MNHKAASQPLGFFLITFLVTWSFWFAAAHVSSREGTEQLLGLLVLSGLLGPLIASLVMIGRSKDPALWRDYWDRLINLKRIRPATVPLMLFLMPAAVLVSALVSLLFGRPAAQFAFTLQFGFSAGCVPVLLILCLAPALEEMGWRGYGMDSLRRRVGLFPAFLWFAPLWAFWHTPLFFIRGYYHHELLSHWVHAANFFASVLPMGFIINWLYYRNRRSVVACFLFHLSADIGMSIFPVDQFTKCIVTIVLILAATAIAVADRKFLLRENASPGVGGSGPVRIAIAGRISS
jgi:hypothetical protein